MTATLAQTREGIRQRFEAIAGIDTAYGYDPGNPTPTCAVVGWPPSYDPQIVMNGSQWAGIIPVRVLVSMADNQAADVTLGNLIEPVVAAFNASPTVATNVDAIVATVDAAGPVQDLQGVQYLSCIFQMDVIAG